MDDKTGMSGVRRTAGAGRRAIVTMVFGAGAFLLPRPILAQSARQKDPPIRQPSARTPQAFMAEAERMRGLAVKAGDQGYGAVVVKGSGSNARIVGAGASAVVTKSDPTAHAEMEAIRDACRRLKSRDLSDCVLYSTFRPCRMCETGAYWAGLSKMVHGAGLTDGGRPKYGC